MKAENIKISVYFTGFEDDEYFEEGYIESFPGNYDTETPGGIDFEELSALVVEHKFHETIVRMGHLLKEINIESISIGIDAYGVMESLASFRPIEYSLKPGSHFFTAGPELLAAYLKQYWEKIRLPDLHEFIWEHEIIHLLDQSLNNSPDFYENKLLEHLLKYRSEGIAELSLMLRDERIFNTIKQARDSFAEEFSRLISLPLTTGSPSSFYKALQSVSPYDIGPFMVLHALSCPGSDLYFPGVEQILCKLENNQAINNDEIYSIIKQALKISDEAFLGLITRPGLDGIPFINKDELYKLIGDNEFMFSPGLCKP